MPTITMEIELTDEFIYDILTTFVESGYSNDWAMFSEVNREVDTRQVLSFTIEDSDWHVNHLSCDPCSEECDKPEFVHAEVGYDEVVEGLRLILLPDTNEDHVGISSSILDYIVRGVREQDAGDIDAIAADCIIQAALFGRLVFG